MGADIVPERRAEPVPCGRAASAKQGASPWIVRSSETPKQLWRTIYWGIPRARKAEAQICRNSHKPGILVYPHTIFCGMAREATACWNKTDVVHLLFPPQRLPIGAGILRICENDPILVQVPRSPAAGRGVFADSDEI